MFLPKTVKLQLISLRCMHRNWLLSHSSQSDKVKELLEPILELNIKIEALLLHPDQSVREFIQPDRFYGFPTCTGHQNYEPFRQNGGESAGVDLGLTLLSSRSKGHDTHVAWS